MTRVFGATIFFSDLLRRWRQKGRLPVESNGEGGCAGFGAPKEEETREVWPLRGGGTEQPECCYGGKGRSFGAAAVGWLGRERGAGRGGGGESGGESWLLLGLNQLGREDEETQAREDEGMAWAKERRRKRRGGSDEKKGECLIFNLPFRSML